MCRTRGPGTEIVGRTPDRAIRHFATRCSRQLSPPMSPWQPGAAAPGRWRNPYRFPPDAGSPELVHALGEIRVRGFHQQAVVIPHLALGVHDPVEALADLGQDLQPRLPILILQIDGLPPVSARGDMVERAGKLDPQGSRHTRSLLRIHARSAPRPPLHSFRPVQLEGQVDDLPFHLIRLAGFNHQREVVDEDPKACSGDDLDDTGHR